MHQLANPEWKIPEAENEVLSHIKENGAFIIIHINDYGVCNYKIILARIVHA